jgi:hypothetical protein
MEKEVKKRKRAPGTESGPGRIAGPAHFPAA